MGHKRVNLAPEQIRVATRLWRAGEPFSVIRRAIGVGGHTLVNLFSPGRDLEHLPRDYPRADFHNGENVRSLTAEQIATATALWDAGESRATVAAAIGISVQTLADLRAPGRSLANLANRQGLGGGRPRGWKPGADEREPTQREKHEWRQRQEAVKTAWTFEERMARDVRGRAGESKYIGVRAAPHGTRAW